MSAGLVNADGTPMQREITRRRQTSSMKKETSKGDVLFKLIVDMPKELGVDDFNRLMVEYFGIGYEAFKAKVR
jgi:hypothetical protein